MAACYAIVMRTGGGELFCPLGSTSSKESAIALAERTLGFFEGFGNPTLSAPQKLTATVEEWPSWEDMQDRSGEPKAVFERSATIGVRRKRAPGRDGDGDIIARNGRKERKNG
jgi:hypothetical protein